MDDIHKLAYMHSFEINKFQVSVNCLNTAWMSQLKTTQGCVKFPDIDLDPNCDCDLCISLFHHPYSWLEKLSGDSLKRKVHNISDIILTGHEHVPFYSEVRDESGANYIHFEGAEFSNGDTQNCEFNFFVIKADVKSLAYYRYSWNKDCFQVKKSKEDISFSRNALTQRKDFSISDSFMGFLEEIDMPLLDKSKNSVKLSDVFVYQNIREEHMIGMQIRNKKDIIKGENVFEYMSTHNYVVLSGTERCGKTGLLKTLYMDFHKNGVVPVLVSGSDITNSELEKFMSTVYKNFVKQYSKEELDKYKQLISSKKCLLVDDFAKSRLLSKNRDALLKTLKPYFKSIIVISNENADIEAIESGCISRELFVEYKRCQILPIDIHQRHKMVKRWMQRDNGDLTEQEDGLYKIKQMELTLDKVVGANYLPPFPVFILTILHFCDDNQKIDLKNGAYGYYYEMVIINCLSKGRHDLDLDSKMTLLSEFAYEFFKLGRNVLSNDQIDIVLSRYCDSYLTPKVEKHSILKDFQECCIFRVDQEGNLSFRFPYLKYYFIARYLSNSLSINEKKSEAKKDILSLISGIYLEENANILIFLTYHSKDNFIIENIVAHSKKIYDDILPYTLEDDTKVIDQLYKGHGKRDIEPKITINSDPLQNHESTLAKAAEIEHQKYGKKDDEHKWEVRNENAHETECAEIREKDRFRKNVSDAIRTLQVMGQLLTNFHGSLTKEPKISLAEECYMLALRTLHSHVILIDHNIDKLRTGFIDFLKKENNHLTPEQLSSSANKFALRWFAVFTRSTFIRVTMAVGSNKLEEVYKLIRKNNPSCAVHMIDIALKMEYLHHIPIEDIISFHAELKRSKKRFARDILRSIVADSASVLHVPHITKQKLSSNLSISFDR